MIMYYRNQPVVLVREDDTHRVTVRLGGGEEVTALREEVSDTPTHHDESTHELHQRESIPVDDRGE